MMNELLLFAQDPGTNKTSMFAGFAALALILLIGYKAKMYFVDKGKGVDDFLNGEIVGSYRTIAGFSTILEVVGLAIIAEQSRGMPIFSGLSRFGTIGIFEIIATFYFQSKVNEYFQEAYADGKLTWGEKIRIIFKSLPLFLLGFCITYFIFILYMESLYNLKVSFTGSLWPWNVLAITPISGEFYDHMRQMTVFPRTIELSAVFLIFCTPVVSIMQVVGLFIATKSSKKSKTSSSPAPAPTTTSTSAPASAPPTTPSTPPPRPAAPVPMTVRALFSELEPYLKHRTVASSGGSGVFVLQAIS